MMDQSWLKLGRFMMAKEKFEDSMLRLEEIVSKLESGNEDLDTAIKLFEEGLSLSKKLNKQLANYEKKIEEITSSQGVANE